MSRYFQAPTQPLPSDLLLELDDETRLHLGHTFTLPLGLPGVGAGEMGNRAPDSRVVVVSGDEIPTVYSVTVQGKLLARSPTEMLEKLDELSGLLKRTRKLWRGERAYIKTYYGVLPSPNMGAGWLSADVAPVFRLAYLGWKDSEGNEVYG